MLSPEKLSLVGRACNHTKCLPPGYCWGSVEMGHLVIFPSPWGKNHFGIVLSPVRSAYTLLYLLCHFGWSPAELGWRTQVWSVLSKVYVGLLWRGCVAFGELLRAFWRRHICRKGWWWGTLLKARWKVIEQSWFLQVPKYLGWMSKREIVSITSFVLKFP